MINILRGEDDVKRNYFSLDLTLRPRQNVQITLEPSFHQLDDSWAWSTKAQLDDGSHRYIFADLAQRTVSAQLRLDYTIRPNLSIQYYGQPFITTGKYTNHKVVTDPRADTFDDRFHQFSENEVTKQDGEFMVDRNQDGNVDYSFNPRDDFTYSQFRSNLVIRWEYLTGSVMYLVWSQGYTYDDDYGQLRMGKDMRSLFNTTSDNVLLLKMSYLLNI
jgi:hypothetical protein